MQTKTRIRYGMDHNGAISRSGFPGALGTQWVAYIRFCGDRAESIGWTDQSAEAATGWDKRAFWAVQHFNKRRSA